eukprot:1138465-Pelagomonas_calceolata.AAC.6
MSNKALRVFASLLHWLTASAHPLRPSSLCPQTPPSTHSALPPTPPTPTPAPIPALLALCSSCSKLPAPLPAS